MTVRLPEDVLDALGAASRRNGMTRHAFVRAALEEAVEAASSMTGSQEAIARSIRARMETDAALRHQGLHRRSATAAVTKRLTTPISGVGGSSEASRPTRNGAATRQRTRP